MFILEVFLFDVILIALFFVVVKLFLRLLFSPFFLLFLFFLLSLDIHSNKKKAEG